MQLVDAASSSASGATGSVHARPGHGARTAAASTARTVPSGLVAAHRDVIAFHRELAVSSTSSLSLWSVRTIARRCPATLPLVDHVGVDLYRRAISATDSWSRTALNAGLCFVRVFFMVSAPPVGAGSNTTLAAGPKTALSSTALSHAHGVAYPDLGWVRPRMAGAAFPPGARGPRARISL